MGSPDATPRRDDVIQLGLRTPRVQGASDDEVVRYGDARAQYERARELGHGSAAARIAQVDAKLGK